MAEKKHHHHLFHHKKYKEDKPIESVYTEPTTGYAETGFSSGGPGGYGESTIEGYGATTISTESEVDYRKEEKHHKHLEHLGEMGAVAAGAYALVIIIYVCVYIYIYIYNLLNLSVTSHRPHRGLSTPLILYSIVHRRVLPLVCMSHLL